MADGVLVVALAGAAVAILTPLVARSMVVMATSSKPSPLMRARELRRPPVSVTTGGEFEAAEWWEEQDTLLQEAWEEFGIGDEALRAWSDEGIALALRCAVRAARASPDEHLDAAARALWEEVAPGVYAAQLFTPDLVERLRRELDRLRDSGIPTRRPNGMNRYGLILSENCPLSAWISGLVDEYARPFAHALFNANVGRGDALEHYAFTVRYAAGEDRELAEHRDASVATLNVNLNREDEGYSGSELRFVDPDDVEVSHTVLFKPGMAVMHLGALRHQAMPIGEGVRTNLICWLTGRGGYVRFAPYSLNHRMHPKEYWAAQPSDVKAVHWDGADKAASSRTEKIVYVSDDRDDDLHVVDEGDL
mmetsp:Transcript_5113/g.14898  ORF Transcript_5113/g.14898 Transcript_5113/m.14898 type:complete len:364 (+) Transcript_5113:3-1094(+)